MSTPATGAQLSGFRCGAIPQIFGFSRELSIISAPVGRELHHPAEYHEYRHAQREQFHGIDTGNSSSGSSRSP
jgi:hypothetical protein